jgi:amino acid permease
MIIINAGKYIYAYMCHTNVVPVSLLLRDTSDAALKRIAGFNVISVCCAYTFVAVIVYFTWGSLTTPLFINAYPDDMTVSTKLNCSMIRSIRTRSDDIT